MKRVLVTGGCGFLGSAIVSLLVDRGTAVRVLALPVETTANLEGLDVEVVRGDLRSADDCARAVAGCDVVFHVAAVYLAWAPDPSRMYEVNLRGTLNMLEASRREGVQQVVYTASIVSLGRPEGGRLGDEQTTYDAWDLDFAYSRSKLLSRWVAEGFSDWGMDVRVICPGAVFGPGDVAPTPSGKLILESVRGTTPPIYMEGGAAYVDVRDAAAVHVLAAEKGRAGERYVAVGHNLSNEALVRAIATAANLRRTYRQVPTAVARGIVSALNIAARITGKEPALAKAFFEYSLVPSYFDASKSIEELGATYRPIEETLRDAIAYFRRVGQLPSA